ncbi:TPA: hypothetical protein ACN30P_003206 [Vibrio parahaemolyticus]
MSKSKPKLIPLKYCNYERAARMLHVEAEDIAHWVEVFYITSYIKGCGSCQITLCVSPEKFDSATEMLKEFSDQDEKFFHGKMVQMFDTENLHIGIDIETLSINYDKKLIFAEGYFSGLLPIRGNGQHLVTNIAFSLDDDESRSTSWVEYLVIFPTDGAEFDELPLITSKELRTIHDALYNNKAFKESSITSESGDCSPRGQSTQILPAYPKQTDLIANLILSNPELLIKYRESASWPDRLNALNSHFEGSTPPLKKLNITADSLNNWLKGKKI